MKKLLTILFGSVLLSGGTAAEIPEASQNMLHNVILRYQSHLPENCEIEFRIDETLPAETFVVSGNQKISIAGGSVRALFYGLGKVLRDNSFRGTDAPKKTARGIYFATHFGNFYDNASEAELRDYVADLSLWGCNEICVWFDMHHFNGIHDPAAQKKIAQLRKIFNAARDCGMHGNLLSLANEAYANSPENLRADWHGNHNNYRSDLSGHYHVEICPNAPGGLELILRWREEVFAAFADCGVDRISTCPYDQGGCTCEKCAPFGAKGYWVIIPKFVELARKHFKNCEFTMSTWRFDSFTDGEWADLFRRDAELKQYVNALSVDPADAGVVAKGAPGNLPMTGFNEISMAGMLPWGGFGANPRPVNFEKEMHRCANFAGVRPYSEGIYEDMNKILMLAWCWNPRPMTEIAGDYFAFYFGEKTRQKGVEATILLEQDLEHRTVLVQGDKRRSAYSAELVDPEKPWHLEYEAKNLDLARAEKALALLDACQVSPEIAASWRWRILYLRAVIDVKLAKNETIDAELEQLYQLYHSTKTTIPCLVPSAEPRWREIFMEKVTQHI